MMSPVGTGLAQAFSAYFLWGLFPLYWMWLKHIPAPEIMAHRILWSFVILLGLSAYKGRLNLAMQGLRDRKTLLLLCVTAVLISQNWLIYIWAVGNGYVIEASLGYYINPLVNMLLGAIFLQERLRRYQYVAAVFALLGVLVLTLTYGRLPWVALVLAFSFAFYALLRKFVALDAQTALLIETGIVVAPALLYLLFGANSQAIFTEPWVYRTLLIGGGAVTILPLMLMTASLKVLTLSTVGFIQYIGPTLQFLCGIFILKESFSTYQAISFSLIWTGLIIYTAEAVIKRRQAK